MYKLNIITEQYWLELPLGVKVKVKPLTTSVFNAAQAWATKEINKVVARRTELKTVGKEDPDLPNLDDEDARYDYLNTMIMKGCAVACIIEWDGIEDPVEDGKVAPLTKENIIKLVEDIRMGNTFWRKVTTEFEKVISEGNLSSLDQNGTSEEEVPIAQPVETEEMNALEEKKLTENSAPTSSSNPKALKDGKPGK
jgi:hypothetical protein